MARAWIHLGPVQDMADAIGWQKRFHQDKGYGIEHRHDGTYWLSWDDRKHTAPPDIGPFETFEAAAACFETLAGLD